MTYADIKRQQAASNPWLANLDTDVYSRLMETLQPGAYESGKDPSWLAQADYWINKGIRATGLPEAAGSVGQAMFGDVGEQVFEGVPRAVLNMAPLAIPGAGWAQAARIGGSALLPALETYGATEKMLPTVLSGVLGAATPAIMGKGSQLAIQAMKTPEDALQAGILREAIKGGATEGNLAARLASHTTAATSPGQVLAGVAGGQGALTGVQNVMEGINIAADPDRSFSEMARPEYWAAQALAQGLFAGLDVARMPSMLRQAGKMATEQRSILMPPARSPLEAPPAREPLRLKGPILGQADVIPLPGPTNFSTTAAREYVERMMSGVRLGDETAITREPFTPSTKLDLLGLFNKLKGGNKKTPTTPAMENAVRNGWIVPVKDAFEAAPESDFGITLDLIGPREKQTFTAKQLDDLLMSDLPVDWATAIAHGAPDNFRATLARIVDRFIREGDDPDAAQMRALVIGRENFRTARRAEIGEPSQKDWLAQKNANVLSERNALAKENPNVQAEIDAVNQASRAFGVSDLNRGDATVVVDPVHSAYRNWLEDGQPGGLAGLRKKLAKTVSTASRGKLKPGQKEFPKAITPELDATLKAIESGDDGALVDLTMKEHESELPPVSEREVKGTAEGLKAFFDQKAPRVQPLRDPVADGQETIALANDPSPEARARLNTLMLERAEARGDGVQKAGTFFGKLMAKMGMSQAEINEKLPIVARLYTAVKELKGMDLAQLTHQGRQAYGLFASGQHPIVMLSGDPGSAKLLGYTLAHELVGHGLWDAHARGVLDPVMSMKLDRTRRFVEEASPATRGEMLRLLAEGMPSKVAKSPKLQRILTNMESLGSADETLAHMNALAAVHLAGDRPGFLRDLVRFLPKPLSDFLAVASRWASGIVRTLKGGFRKDPMWDILSSHENAMRDIMRADMENQADALRLEAFARMQEPGGLLSMTKDVKSAGDWFDTVFDTKELDKFGSDIVKYMAGTDDLRAIGREAKDVGKAFGRLGGSFAQWLVHMFRPIHQIGAATKPMRFFAQIGSRRRRMQSEYLMRLAQIMSGKQTGAFVQFAKDSPMHRIYTSGNRDLLQTVNDIFAWANPNDMSKTAYQHILDETPGMKALFDKIPEEYKNDVKKLAAQIGEVGKLSREIQRVTSYDHLASSVATGSLFQVPGQDHGLSYEPVHGLFQKAADGLKAGVVPDYNALLTDASALMGPERGQKAVNVFKAYAEAIEEKAQLQEKAPGFISERRIGPIKITYVLNGRTDIIAVDTPAEAEQTKRFLESEGATQIVERKTEGAASVPGEKLTAVDRALEDVNMRTRQKLLGLGFDEATVDALATELDVRPELAAAEAARDITATNLPRSFTAGRRYLDFVKQAWTHTEAVIRAKSMRIAESQIRGMENDSALRDLPEAKSILQGFLNYKTPDTPSMRAISKFSYFMTLGLNTANYMQEMAQPIVAFPWKLVDEGAGMVEANRLVANAYKTFFKVWSKKKFLVGGELDFSGLSADHKALLEDARMKRILESTGFTEFEEGAITNLFHKGAVTMGRLDEKIGRPVVEAATRAGQLLTRLHNKVTSLSSGVATIAAYDFLRARGRTHEQAVKESYALVEEGMLTGGREGRAAGVYNTGAARPVASMMMALQGYSLGTIAQMGQYLHRGLSKAHTPAERLAARKAAAGLMLTHLALAGVMGMPGVGAALRLVQQATGFDLEKALEFLSDADQDPGSSAMMKDVALHGFSQLLGGPDVSQKYGMSSVLGFNEVDGFSLENLLGPVGTYAKRFGEGVGQVAGGNLGEAAESVAPVALRKMMQMWNDDWQFRSPDNDETLIKNPTFTEKVGYALGFQPVRLNKARRAYTMARRAREAKYESDKQEMDRLADAYLEGDQQAIMDGLAERVKSEGENYDHRATALKIAERVEKKMFPRDPGQEGTRYTSAEDEAVLRALGVFSESQEAQRAAVRDQVLTQLGARGIPQSSLEQYRQIDVLRKRNPFLTVPQARAILERRRGESQQIPPALRAMMPAPALR